MNEKEGNCCDGSRYIEEGEVIMGTTVTVIEVVVVMVIMIILIHVW